MTKILLSLHAVHYFSTIMTKKIIRIHLCNLSQIGKLKSHRIEKNIFYFQNKIYTSFNNKAKKLNLFLKELIFLPDDIKSFDASYIYYAKNTILPVKIDDTIKTLILRLLQKENLYPFINLLYQSSLLIKLIPTLKMIINQPQFDGYHTHPIDVHSIQTLYHL